MLFWTDGHYDIYGGLVGSEPKKINITRSIEGTDIGGQTHTRIVNPELPTLDEPVRPHHIQVLKRKPTKSLNVNLQDNRRPGVVYSTTTFKFSNPSTSNLYSVGFTSTITVDSGSPGTPAGAGNPVEAIVLMPRARTRWSASVCTCTCCPTWHPPRQLGLMHG